MLRRADALHGSRVRLLGCYAEPQRCLLLRLLLALASAISFCASWRASSAARPDEAISASSLDNILLDRAGGALSTRP